MACPKLLSFLLFPLLFIFIFINTSHASPRNNVTKAQSHTKPDKVNLSLYYESLCPYCRSFIVSQLAKVFDTDLLNIINLKLVPWGNAEYVKSNKTIVCQHGEDECYLNTIHACAIKIWPDSRKHFKFIYCVENQGLYYKNNNQHSVGADAVWRACTARLGMDQKLIKDCYDSGYGTKLSMWYATETNDLHPKHLYVPWVTVNDQPLYDKYENFITYVCNAYKDKVSVKTCLYYSLKVSEDRFSTSPICYAKTKTKSQDDEGNKIEAAA